MQKKIQKYLYFKLFLIINMNRFFKNIIIIHLDNVKVIIQGRNKDTKLIPTALNLARRWIEINGGVDLTYKFKCSNLFECNRSTRAEIRIGPDKICLGYDWAGLKGFRPENFGIDIGSKAWKHLTVHYYYFKMFFSNIIYCFI